MRHLLSRKQLWRKTRSEQPPCQLSAYMLFAALDVPPPPPLRRVKERERSPTLTDTIDSPRGKRVEFSDTNYLTLIPSREELDKELLYWTRDDVRLFKENAVEELLAYARSRIVGVRVARAELYQPQFAGFIDPAFE